MTYQDEVIPTENELTNTINKISNLARMLETGKVDGVTVIIPPILKEITVLIDGLQAKVDPYKTNLNTWFKALPRKL